MVPHLTFWVGLLPFYLGLILTGLLPESGLLTQNKIGIGPLAQDIVGMGLSALTPVSAQALPESAWATPLALTSVSPSGPARQLPMAPHPFLFVLLLTIFSLG